MINKYFGGIVPAAERTDGNRPGVPGKNRGMVRHWLMRTWMIWPSARPCRQSGKSSPPATSTSTKPLPGPWQRTRPRRTGSPPSCTACWNHSASSFICSRRSCRKPAVKALEYLGWHEPVTEAGLHWGGLQPDTQIIKAEALFPRIEEKGEG